jgi:hypothetical protein
MATADYAAASIFSFIHVQPPARNPVIHADKTGIFNG